jgi:hypothetical protein
MAIDVRQVVTNEGAVREPHFEESIAEPNHLSAIMMTEGARHGHWKVAQRTTAGTTIIAAPELGGSLALTDIIVSTDKTAGSSLTLQFTDGSNTEVLAVFDSVNAPVAVSITVGGRLQGWEDARLEMVTVGTVTANVTLGYIKSPIGENYALWDAKR